MYNNYEDWAGNIYFLKVFFKYSIIQKIKISIYRIYFVQVEILFIKSHLNWKNKYLKNLIVIDKSKNKSFKNNKINSQEII